MISLSLTLFHCDALIQIAPFRGQVPACLFPESLLTSNHPDDDGKLAGAGAPPTRRPSGVTVNSNDANLDVDLTPMTMIVVFTWLLQSGRVTPLISPVILLRLLLPLLLHLPPPLVH